MAEEPKNLEGSEKKNAEKLNRWADISSDEDDNDSDDSEISEEKQAQQKKENVVHNNNQSQKKHEEPKVKPFDPAKNLRGGFGYLKRVKGGFKPEKLERKRFELGAIDNPFQMQNDDDSEDQNDDDKETQQEESKQPAQTIEKQKEEVPKKLTKKEKKQKEKREFEEALAQLGGNPKEQKSKPQEKSKEAEVKKPEEGEQAQKKKKKKKNKGKKEEDAQQVPEKNGAEEPAEEFQVDKNQLEDILKKKAEGTKTSKKTNKLGGMNAAKEAMRERQGKAKQNKKNYDL